MFHPAFVGRLLQSRTQASSHYPSYEWGLEPSAIALYYEVL